MSVVIATIGRLTLLRAVKSIFDQKFEGKIQILIGIDIDQYGNINNIPIVVLIAIICLFYIFYKILVNKFYIKELYQYDK